MKKNTKVCVTVIQDGPYKVAGNVPMSLQIIKADKKGFSVEWKEGKKFPKEEEISLCRCGQSKNQPYCDGSHTSCQFKGEEKASHEPFMNCAQRFEGPTLTLLDCEDLCAYARFCDVGKRVWELAQNSGNPEDRALCIKEAQLCPAGRLVVVDKETGQTLEPATPPSIGLVEDPSEEVSGPIWLRGGIPVIGADGRPYEVREQQTLCRCGRSRNKPFCDGTHSSAGYKDGIK